MIRGEGAVGRSAAVQSLPASLAGAPARTVRARAGWGTVWKGVSSVLIALLTAIAMLLFIDWLLFETPLLASHWRLGLNDGSPADKLLIANRYLDSKVLFLGDSRTLYGIDPEVVSRECGCGAGFNAGFSAADPGLNRMMADRLLEKMSPRAVVISVSQWELSDRATIHVDEPIRELTLPWQLGQHGRRISDNEDAQMAGGSVWRLYNYRGQLRNSLEGWAGRQPPENQRRGYLEYRENTRLREKDLDSREEQFFDDFSVRGRRAQELRGLISDLRRRDIEVVLVAPPLFPRFQTRVKRQVASYTETMKQISRETGASFEDLTVPKRSGLTDKQFKDIVHLNVEGAAKYSRHIGKVLKARLNQG